MTGVTDAAEVDGPIVIYDGVCLLCNRSARFIAAHDRSGRIRFAAVQNAPGAALMRRYGLDPETPESFLVLEGGVARTRARAVLHLAGYLDRPWRWGRCLRILPLPVLDWVYSRVARNRYRIFGRADQCLAPTPEFRDRILES